MHLNLFPDQFPSFTGLNVNQNNKHNSSDEENTEIDFDKSALVASMYFHNAYHMKPNRKQKKTKVFVSKRVLKATTDSDFILNRSNTNQHGSPKGSQGPSNPDSLSLLNQETSNIYGNPWNEIREINEKHHDLYSGGCSTISGIQDFIGFEQTQEPRANSLDLRMKASISHEPETLNTTSPSQLEEDIDFEEFEEIELEMSEEAMGNEFDEVIKADKEIIDEGVLEPEDEESKMSLQDVFISDLEDTPEVESNDFKITFQNLPSEVNLSNDFKTKSSRTTVRKFT